MNIQQLYQNLSQTLSESDARYVLKKRAGVTHTDLLAHPDKGINPKILSDIERDMEQVHQGIPLSRIYGEAEFWGLPFKLSEDTLDPRDDTECLVEAVLERYLKQDTVRILDLGTGSGCILISLLSELSNASGVGVDLSIGALETAKENARQNHVSDRAVFIQSNWAESIDEKFDIVVSNPPYIQNQVIQNLDENVKNHDPILALDGGEDGLQAYKNIFSNLSALLKSDGRAFFEIGFDQRESVTRLSRESRFSVISTYADFAGHTRVIEVVSENSSGDK